MIRPLLALVLSLALSFGLYAAPAQAAGNWPTFNALPVASVPAGDIKKFVKAYQALQTIRDEAEEKMAAAVEAEGLTIDEFNALADQALAGNPPATEAATAQKFEAAIERIATLRDEAEGTMTTAIEKAGISLERFNQILEESDKDADLYQRIGDQINGR